MCVFAMAESEGEREGEEERGMKGWCMEVWVSCMEVLWLIVRWQANSQLFHFFLDLGLGPRILKEKENLGFLPLSPILELVWVGFKPKRMW